MKLTELDPKWLVRDGRRVGVIFRCPNRRKWWLTCFAEPLAREDQYRAVVAAVGETQNWMPCREIAWTFHGGLTDFESLTIAPSIDAGADWFHGFITKGEVA